MRRNRIPSLFKMVLFGLFATLATGIMVIAGGNDFWGKTILAEASLPNGRAIFKTGKFENGIRVPIQGGPHWIHSDGGGCATCHGPNGLGGIEPDFCSIVTPPISYRYLVGNGYHFTQRQNGTHPPYTLRTLKIALQSGINSRDYEMDYCMPRWRMNDSALRDLAGYLTHLDTIRK